MKKLEIILTPSKKTAVFSGDTFSARESIKALGISRWDPIKKAWVVSGLSFGRDELQDLFPNAEISIEGTHTSLSVELPATSEEDSSTIRKTSKKRPLPDSPANSNLSILSGATSVSDLSALIKFALARQFPGEVKVYGVVNSLKILASGRVYFDLVDVDQNDHSIKCVIWEGGAVMLRPLIEAGFPLENDLPILIGAQVRLNQKNGQISLHLLRVIPEYTLGKLLAEREKTNRRLTEEGIFAKNKGLSLPLLPRKLGILTSPGGTVINDFKASLEVCGFGFELYWCPVRVQGREAVSDILAGLKALEAIDDIDAILIFRGGGSAIELGVFNEYKIARAICLCSKPVCSAIGHEFDQSSTQDVSFIACGVPKDLGRFFSDRVIDLRSRIRDSVRAISIEASRTVREKESRSVHLASALVNLFNLKLKDWDRRLNDRVVYLRSSGAIRLQKQTHALHVLINNLSSSSAALSQSAKVGLSEVLNSIVRNVERERTLAKNRITLSVQGTLMRSFSILSLSSSHLQGLRGVAQYSQGLLRVKENILKEKEGLFEAVSPQAQLRRGFALIKRLGAEDMKGERVDQESCYLTSASQIAESGDFLIEMIDGNITGRVIEGTNKIKDE